MPHRHLCSLTRLTKVLVLAAMMGVLKVSFSAAVENAVTHQLMGRRVAVVAGGEPAAADADVDTTTSISIALPTLVDFRDVEVLEHMPNMLPRTPPTKSLNEYHGARGSGQPAHRRTADLDDMLNNISTLDPSQWSAAEWLVVVLSLAFLGLFGCCLLTLCCCGGGGGGDLLRCLCCYEICCRGGSDIDACCDNYEIC